MSGKSVILRQLGSHRIGVTLQMPSIAFAASREGSNVRVTISHPSPMRSQVIFRKFLDSQLPCNTIGVHVSVVRRKAPRDAVGFVALRERLLKNVSLYKTQVRFTTDNGVACVPIVQENHEAGI